MDNANRIRAYDRVPGFQPLAVEFEERRRRIDRRLNRRFAHFTERRKQHEAQVTKQQRDGRLDVADPRHEALSGGAGRAADHATEGRVVIVWTLGDDERSQREWRRLEARVHRIYRIRIAKRRLGYVLSDFRVGFLDGFRPWVPLIKSATIAGALLLLLRYASLWLAAFGG